MNWVDILITVTLLGTTFLGYKIGVIRAAWILGSFTLATIIGARGSVVFASRMGELMKDQDLGYLVSFIAVFALTFFVLSLVGNIICRMADFPPLKWVDGFIGGVLGFLAGIALVGLVIIYLTKFPTANSEQWLNGSFLASVVEAVISPIFQEFLRKNDIANSVAFV